MAKKKFGIVGIGGYGGEVIRDLLAHWDNLPVEFIAAHDPMAAKFPDRVQQMKDKRILFYDTYQQFLASPVEALWLPVPIDLHRSMTEQALAAGKDVLCEKPAAGSIQDVDAMIRARDAAEGTVAIGYQHLWAASTHEIKRRLLAGDVGNIKHATVMAAGKRHHNYYARPWAGKLQRNGIWLLDSPANNAFAHWVHVALFLLGPTQETSATPLSVEAELYRANPIENYDTCCLRITLHGDRTLMVCLTHATDENRNPTLRLNGDRGAMLLDSRAHRAVFEGGAHPGEIATSPSDHIDTLKAFAAYLEDPKKPHASLEMSRAHATVISGASQCTPVISVPNELIQTCIVEPTPINPGGTVRYIPGIVPLFETAIKNRQMLHETKMANWTRPGGKIDLRNYKEFTGVPK
jgi:predicted dehydrogenase